MGKLQAKTQREVSNIRTSFSSKTGSHSILQVHIMYTSPL